MYELRDFDAANHSTFSDCILYNTNNYVQYISIVARATWMQYDLFPA
jgi:hypothetical protein